MIIAYTDQNDCDFAIKLLDDSKAELAKELMSEGMDAWYSAAHVPVEATEHFTKEDVEAMYGDGYAEPTYKLLDRFKIPYEKIELQYDENGDVIADEMVA